MSIDTIPLQLHKANLELQLQITRLTQEGGQRWLEVAAKAGSEGIAEAKAEIEGVKQAGNWQSLATLPGESFWRMLQHRVGDSQDLTQAAIKNQAAFASGLQEAIESWQKSVGEVFGSTGSTQPVKDLFKQWASLWPIPGAQPQAKSAESA